MRRDLPSGTVTFLFTDVEGSTRLLHELGADGYGQALAEHRRVLRGAFAAQGGVEVDTQGDAFFYAFPEAPAAAAAAQAGQEALAPGAITVRMGLHTGEPLLWGDHYVGDDVHLGARVGAAGHGGQVVLSKATRDLLDETLVRDLGEHRVKDFEAPVWIYQLGEDLFPPLKTISNTNLPRPASAFVGRERETAEVTALVRKARLVTLKGPGGSGKTRLSIEAAAELVGEFRNGVFWVGLSTVRDPIGVVPAIAETIGAAGDLAQHVGEREMLLLLDNLEQVVAAAPELAGIVEACPNLRMLVTSRELLRVRGEVEYEVLPLAAPDAVELFSMRSGVSPTPAVEELCRRLDNMPLALELAAARTRALTPDQILDRLGERLDLFKGGRDADDRQKTLRTTIEWSHDLLVPEEAAILHRLGVFAGGCTFAAAEAVCGADLDTVQSLVEKSLLRHTGDRFWMLETIREYAVERLGDAPDLRERFARFYLDLAESAALNTEGREHGAPDRSDLVLREEAIELFREVGDEAAVAHLMMRLGSSAAARGENELARRFLAESIDECRRLGSRVSEGQAIGVLGVVDCKEGDTERGIWRIEESSAISHEVGFTWWEINMVSELADQAFGDGRLDDSERWGRRCLGLAVEIGNRANELWALGHLAAIAAARDDGERAGRLWGATEAEEARGPVGEWNRALLEELVVPAGSGEFEGGRAAGRLLSLDEAVEYALSDA